MKELTQIAVEFTEFCRDECYFDHKEYKWRINNMQHLKERYTTEELFNYFYKKVYE
jgi:hypothetical protein